MVAKDLRMIMAEMGFKTVNEMIGRVDCLETDIAIDHWKRNGLEFEFTIAPTLRISDLQGEVGLDSALSDFRRGL